MKELRGQRCYSEKVYRKYIHRQAYFLGSYYSSTEVHTMNNEECKNTCTKQTIVENYTEELLG